jgi:hypothetical protein
LSILPENGKKPDVLFPGELDHAQLCEHDRPAENRNDRQKEKDKFPGNGRVLEREKETAGGYDLREEHSRITGVSNSSLSSKRKRNDDTSGSARVSRVALGVSASAIALDRHLLWKRRAHFRRHDVSDTNADKEEGKELAARESGD